VAPISEKVDNLCFICLPSSTNYCTVYSSCFSFKTSRNFWFKPFTVLRNSGSLSKP